MLHSKRYSSKGRSRLAADCGISKSAITRLLSGRSKPTFRIMWRIADALERDLGRKLDMRDLFSETGEYPCTFVCQLLGCSGCLPARATQDDGRRNPKYHGLKRGFWTGDVHETDGPFWQPIKEVE